MPSERSAAFASPPDWPSVVKARTMPQTVPARPMSGPRFPMTLRISMRRAGQFLAPASSAASRMEFRERPMLRAAASTMFETKVPSAWAVSFTSSKRPAAARERRRSMTLVGRTLESRISMRQVKMTVKETSEPMRMRMVKKSNDCLKRSQTLMLPGAGALTLAGRGEGGECYENAGN